MRLLCRRFAISPTTGYKWLARFASEGQPGLCERSRRPLRSPRRTPASIETAVLAMRRAHPAWGGRKIAARLKAMGVDAPAASTVTAVLARHGESIGAAPAQAPFMRFERAAPNELWQMDFKGHVALARGRLHPLTVLDDHSRFAVALEACADQRLATVKAALIKAFARYGLPVSMITDNGPPWGDGAGGFTALSVFLMEQDIVVAHARPHHPQTLGKDERFHRSLKAEVLAGRVFADLAQAASALARWREIYNFERPHEAVAMAAPITRYALSTRRYRAIAFDYAPDDCIRRVDSGRVAIEGRRFHLSKAFNGKLVAMRPTARDGVFEAFFRSQKIADLDLNARSRHD